ncbi:MAG: HD domain-containing protein [Bacteroidota bacterium]
MPERHKRQEGAWQSHMRPGQEPFSPVLLETVLRAPGTIMVGPSYRVPENLRDNSRILPGDDELSCRTHVRIQSEAALCHDIGNLPFSHAAEKELLPPGWSHEHLAVELIKKMEPLLRTSDVLKIAVGPKKLSSERYSDGEAILSEIIVRDALGADRIDYLLRDSYHAGVAYGRFDHYRLIDTMRILPKGEGDSMEPRLGVEIGGLPSAEALLLARYFMYAQVYCHPVRRAYDMHLKNLLREWVDKEEVTTGS